MCAVVAIMDDNERRLCARANIGKWFVYFFSYFDYAKSYECLTEAEEQAKGFADITSRVYLNFGAMYQTMAEQSKDKKTLNKALAYCLTPRSGMRTEAPMLTASTARMNTSELTAPIST